MIQGRNIQLEQQGMRRGISLVEMMIAIILFGLISIIGYKYSSNFYDTKLASKRALVASLVEQATQLSNGYDIYSIQFGTAPTDESNLTQANVRILTAIPTTITEIGTVGWNLDTGNNVGGTAANDITFVFDIATTVTNDDDEYCAMLNNMVNPTVDLNTSAFPLGTFNPTTMGNAFCYDNAGTLQMVFVQELL